MYVGRACSKREHTGTVCCQTGRAVGSACDADDCDHFAVTTIVDRTRDRCACCGYRPAGHVIDIHCGSVDEHRSRDTGVRPAVQVRDCDTATLHAVPVADRAGCEQDDVAALSVTTSDGAASVDRRRIIDFPHTGHDLRILTWERARWCCLRRHNIEHWEVVTREVSDTLTVDPYTTGWCTLCLYVDRASDLLVQECFGAGRGSHADVLLARQLLRRRCTRYRDRAPRNARRRSDEHRRGNLSSQSSHTLMLPWQRVPSYS